MEGGNAGYTQADPFIEHRRHGGGSNVIPKLIATLGADGIGCTHRDLRLRQASHARETFVALKPFLPWVAVEPVLVEERWVEVISRSGLDSAENPGTGLVGSMFFVRFD